VIYIGYIPDIFNENIANINAKISRKTGMKILYRATKKSYK
jgi:hypothetical protein